MARTRQSLSLYNGISQEKRRRRREHRPLILRFIRMNPERSVLDTNW